MISEENDVKNSSWCVISKEVSSAMIDESTFKIDMLEIRPSCKLAKTTISLCLSKGGELFPISGFPRHLESKKDEYAVSQVSEKGRDAQNNEVEDNASIKVSMDSSTFDL